MPLDITCPGCGLTDSAPDKMHGKTVKCQRCDTPIQVRRPSMVVPVDAALLQQAAAMPRPQRPATPRVDPSTQPRVRSFSYIGILLAILLFVLPLLLSGVVRLFLK